MTFTVCTEVGQFTVPMVPNISLTLLENEVDGFATLKLMLAEGLAAVDQQLRYARSPAESWPLREVPVEPKAA